MEIFKDNKGIIITLKSNHEIFMALAEHGLLSQTAKLMQHPHHLGVVCGPTAACICLDPDLCRTVCLTEPTNAVEEAIKTAISIYLSEIEAEPAPTVESATH